MAVKILQRLSPGMCTAFRDECKLLLPKHPHIAHIINADEGKDGLPWMAMEYVNGLSLSDYIKEHQPDLKKRIELFLQVCDAMVHAHRQMIIHSPARHLCDCYTYK